MYEGNSLGIDCGSVSLNLALLSGTTREPVTVYRRTRGRPLETFLEAVEELRDLGAFNERLDSVLVTGSARELFSEALDIPAVNEISAHAHGIHWVDPRVRTVIEIGGQDSKFIKIEPPVDGNPLTFPVFRMNEICAAGTGAFLDEQAARLGIPVEELGATAMQSTSPAPIAGRCAVFAKTDMIHRAQEGMPLPDILLGLAFALARNYMATLLRGDALTPVVSLQGGVMANSAVVHAFIELLELDRAEVIVPQHYKVMGAVGSAVMGSRLRDRRPALLSELTDRARVAIRSPRGRRRMKRLDPGADLQPTGVEIPGSTYLPRPPLVMGLDVGSVSVKGVIIDAAGVILAESYRLSQSKPLEGLQLILADLLSHGIEPTTVAVTGSGRYLAGRLLNADLIVNEISAQAAAALDFDPTADTVVEIGGQDSKWISLADGQIIDFEMNRVCAAGTGSFIMEQADRLGLEMGEEFSRAAFESDSPADLGSRCTVFMESDLIHHQNNGASYGDLAAGVCLSVVSNYLERTANNKAIGKKVLFLGGVAASPAVRAAFEQQTGREIHVPGVHRVSGAYGAALKARDAVLDNSVSPDPRDSLRFEAKEIRREQFRCSGCPNRCLIDKYFPEKRIVFHGGMCDKWEREEKNPPKDRMSYLMTLRSEMLERLVTDDREHDTMWGMIRSPQFYEWFPFWKEYCDHLGIGLQVPARPNRAQFEKCARCLKVETCMPVKIMAGQVAELAESGIETIFHPSVLSAPADENVEQVMTYCPYIQASSQFFRGSVPVEWKEPVTAHETDPDSLRREHIQFAESLGYSPWRAREAVRKGQAGMAAFNATLKRKAEKFINDLPDDRPSIVVLGKPYHTAESFANMNLASLFDRLGIAAVPSDLFPLSAPPSEPSVEWKFQDRMVSVARETARHSRIFPVMITYFGCGPDPFTIRHIRNALAGKPMLVLEMDEHTSRAGIMTRLEAYLDRIRTYRRPGTRNVRSVDAAIGSDAEVTPGATAHESAPTKDPSDPRPPGDRKKHEKKLFIPFMGDAAYGFTAAARSVGVDAEVLPEPDEESVTLGRPFNVGGECFPFTLVLGDYLKLADRLSASESDRSIFYMVGSTACRLGQYPVYMEQIRKEIGSPLPVLADADEVLTACGLSRALRQDALLTAWQGLNAFDILAGVFYELRPHADDMAELERLYRRCRDIVCTALAEGRIRQGMDDALHELYKVGSGDRAERPVVAVTGDYYTRIVPFANNRVFDEIERLGGTVWSPPTFSDSMKMASLRDFIWTMLSGSSRRAARNGALYFFLASSELKVKGSRTVRSHVKAPLDIVGYRRWRSTARYAHTRLPGGITAPIVTSLQQIEAGADGLLNLITLNCSYGTVVTAALSRELHGRYGVPMLTLVYEGLQKTNEKTRLEAFMQQVTNRWEIKRRAS
jgi:predicted CoA-substrate-specific enzyme activase